MSAKKILIVDQEPFVRELVSGVLEGRGYETLCAGGGDAAAALLGEKGADMVLLGLPRDQGEGSELLKRFRQDERLRRVPLVVVGDCEDRELLDGLSGRVGRREFALETLLDEVRRCLEAKKSICSSRERRSAFRVRTSGHELEAWLNGHGPWEVLDLSAEGLGVLSTTDLDVGEAAGVRVSDGLSSFEGRAWIRSRTPMGHGCTRYGMELRPGGGDLGRGLAVLSTRIQREQLKLRSRLRA